jgi:flagellar protein FlaI
MIRTKVDDLADMLKLGDLSMGEAAKRIDWPVENVDRVVRVLETHAIVDLTYPLNIAEDPVISLKKKFPERQAQRPSAEWLETYSVKSSNLASSQVKIFWDGVQKRPAYFVELPSVSEYTKAFFEYLQDEIAKSLPPEASGVVGSKKAEATVDKFALISQHMKSELSPPEKDVAQLTGIIMRNMYGLSDIDVLMADEWIEEIVINKGDEPISIYHRKHGWMKTNIYLGGDDEIANLSSLISRRAGRQISVLSPLLDAQLDTGDRVNATLAPISSNGNTLTIRKFSRNPWTIVNLTYGANRVMSAEMAALIWQAVHYEMNLLIGGGTASGKTSVLNAVISLIPAHQRLVTIEDTRELLPASIQWNWIPLVSRSPNQEGKGEVTTLDLMVNSLRMRPDRIVLGEIRRKAEAEVLFEAMHTGHSVIATVHADTGTQLINRLTQPPIEIPPNELEAINLIVMQYRDRRINLRRTLELSEVVPAQGKPDLNHIYIWRPRNDTHEFVKPPSRYFEQLNLHTGMIEREIMEDQRNKAKIIKWMNDWKCTDVDRIGALMKSYYADEESMLRAAEKNASPEKV